MKQYYLSSLIGEKRYNPDKFPDIYLPYTPLIHVFTLTYLRINLNQNMNVVKTIYTEIIYLEVSYNWL